MESKDRGDTEDMGDTEDRGDRGDTEEDTQVAGDSMVADDVSEEHNRTIEEEEDEDDGEDDDDDGEDDDDDDDGEGEVDGGGSDDDDVMDEEGTLVQSGEGVAKETKKSVPGIVYLGHIPPRLRPKHVRNMLGVYGEIGRVFLQPEDRSVKRRKKKAGSNASSFTEGWVEFRDKRVAKRVAASLHNTGMGARKRSRFHSDLWCIKYLHRFQWCHLSERLAYEQMVLQQRLRTEISQAKRETNFYLANVEKSASMDKLRKTRERKGEKVEEKTWDFTQRKTEDEIQLSRMKKQGLSKKNLQKAQDKAKVIQAKSQSNVSLLAKIFNSSKGQG